PHHSATPPLGLMPLHLRADDGIRTRDPHLGKVMRYQLRYIRAPRARSSPVAMQNISARRRADTNPHYGRGKGAQNQCFRTGGTPPLKTENPWAVTVCRWEVPSRRTPGAAVPGRSRRCPAAIRAGARRAEVV